MTDRAREKPMFDRVVVKLSGEALMGPDPFGLNAPTVQRISADLKAVSELGVQVAVVVGGGNFFRGLLGAEKGIERARADSIGMLATVMNALALEGALIRGVQLLEPFLRDRPWPLIDAINAVDGLLIFCVALIILEMKKIQVADYYPSLLFAPLLAWGLW